MKPTAHYDSFMGHDLDGLIVLDCRVDKNRLLTHSEWIRWLLHGIVPSGISFDAAEKWLEREFVADYIQILRESDREAVSPERFGKFLEKCLGYNQEEQLGIQWHLDAIMVGDFGMASLNDIGNEIGTRELLKVAV